jgi:uncharacterized membrane protein YhhN
VNGSPTLALGLFVIATAVALFGLDRQRRWLFATGKPAAVLALLAVAWGPAPDAFGALVCAGLFLSFLGDVVLLKDSQPAFLTGLTLFLFAHLLYAAAFALSGAMVLGWSTALPGLAIFGTATLWLMGRLWAGIGRTLRGPVVVYALAITAMVSLAYASLGGPWPPLVSGVAALGAVLFYLSDASLAWNRFVHRSVHGQTITLSLYWTGQLGIAVAARWAAQGMT